MAPPYLDERSAAMFLRTLGLDATALAARGLPFQAEASALVPIGVDVFGREQTLELRTAHAWQRARAAAASDGIELLVVSAFRSHEAQRLIVERKLAAGQAWEAILRISMAPGFSEHHTGRALDLTTPGCTPLTEEFAETTAFAWLARHAGDFGFGLSYPRDNPQGITYEPWHWAKAEG